MHLMKAIFPNLPFLAFLQSQFDNVSTFDKLLALKILDVFAFGMYNLYTSICKNSIVIPDATSGKLLTME